MKEDLGYSSKIAFIISSPSGTGKTTVCKNILSKYKDIKLSISSTTRSVRGGEVDGVDYFFTDKQHFEQNIKDDMFLEYAQVHGNYYGTPKNYVYESFNNGYDLLFDIDYQGALSIKKHTEIKTVLIFLLPPSIEELQKRLELRKRDSSTEIASRIAIAKKEISFSSFYDYVLINQDIDLTMTKVYSIIESERIKANRENINKFIQNVLY
jgi:guanylate kinase